MERGDLKAQMLGEPPHSHLYNFCQSLAIIISENPTSEDPFFLACWLLHKIENATSEDHFFCFVFFFLPVYWLKHIFGSITSEASIKSITSIFFFYFTDKI